MRLHGLTILSLRMMMRIALGIEYDGSQYYGWQRQAHAGSVQQTLEQAISKVANESITVHVAGRTDTGVHATEQVIHFDCANERENKAWVMGVNTNLPNSISVLWANIVDEDFHARYSASSRRYRYIVLNQSTRSALLNKQVTWIYQPLDETKMQKAANFLLGQHDFTSFRAVACQAKNPIKTVHELKISRKDKFVLIDVHADGFLHHMVRNIVGVLIAIGSGEQDVNWSREVLDYRDRTLGGVTASADGLYLVKVQYDRKYELDSNIRWPAIAN